MGPVTSTKDMTYVCACCHEEYDAYHKAQDCCTPEAQPKQAEDPAAGVDVGAVLSARGSRYGRFEDHARVTQRLKGVLEERITERGLELSFDQQEALDMICHKLGRIVNGDPNYDDSWIDIAGYAQLVADRLRGQSR